MSRNILTVDDSKPIRDMVSFTLSQAGYAVAEAENGCEALTRLDHFSADLVITDINMPEMDGYTLLKSLRCDARFKRTPILVLTTEGDENSKAQGKSLGATGWIVKPFNPEKLLEVIRKVCP